MEYSRAGWSGGVPQRMRVPSFIHIELTTECGANCPQCYAKSTSAPAHMEVNLLRRIVLQAAKAGIPCILLTGGEPLIYPHLAECVELITSKGIRAALSTSGMNLTHDLALKLKQAGLSEACVSLNGSTCEVHSLSRTGFHAATSAAQMFNACGVPTCVNWVARSDNVRDFLELVALCKKLGVQRIDILSCKRHGGLLESALSEHETALLAEMIMKGGSDYIGIELCYDRLRSAVKHAPKPPFSGKCAAGRCFFDVLVDGSKTICRHIDTAGASDTKEMTLMQYWNEAGKKLKDCRAVCQISLPV